MSVTRTCVRGLGGGCGGRPSDWGVGGSVFFGGCMWVRWGGGGGAWRGG